MTEPGNSSDRHRGSFVRAPLLALVAAAALACAIPTEARADNGVPDADAEVARRIDEKVRDLDDLSKPHRWGGAARDLLNLRHPRATQALASRLTSDTVEPQRKQAIVDAFLWAWDETEDGKVKSDIARDAVKLLFPFLAATTEPGTKLRDQSIATLGLMDDSVITDAAKVILFAPVAAWAPSVAERQAAAKIIASRPIEMAVKLLMTALRIADLPSEAHAAILEELRRLTGNDFRRREDALAWWAANEHRPVHVWLRERIDRQDKELKQARETAFAWWKKYVDTLAGNPEALLAVLKEVLAKPADAEVSTVRADAARRLGALQRSDGYEALLAGLREEADQDVLKARIKGLAGAPSQDGLRGRITDAIVEYMHHDDREVRIETARTLGSIEAHKAIPYLLARLRRPDRSREVALTILDAFAKMTTSGPPRDPDLNRALVEGVSETLEVELARNPRDMGLLEAAAIAVGGLDVPAGVPEEGRLLEALEKCLREGVERPADTAAARVRLFAAKAVREFCVRTPGPVRRERALAALAKALEDAQTAVAVEAAKALAAIAKVQATPAKDRNEVLLALGRTINGRPDDVKREAFGQIREILESQPAAARDVPVMKEVADRLYAAKDYERLRSLLALLSPEAARPEVAAMVLGLRRMHAEALVELKDPNAIAAWDGLVRADRTFRPGHAAALLALGDPALADEQYALLIEEVPAERPTWWARRLDCAKRPFEAKDYERSLRILSKILAGQDVPAEVRTGAEELKRRAEGELAAPSGGGGGAAPVPPAPPGPGAKPDSTRPTAPATPGEAPPTVGTSGR